MMKKILLIMFLIVGISVYTEQEVCASQKEIYFETTVCPDEVVMYAENNVGRFVFALCEEYGYNINDFKMGKPFKVFGYEDTDLELFMFPISYQGEFSYLFSVHVEGGTKMIPSISSHLVPEIKEKIEGADNKGSIKIFTNNGNLYLEIDNHVEELFIYEEKNDIEYDMLELYADDTILTDIFEYSDIRFEVVEKNNTIKSTYPAYKYIALSRTETQDNNSWCAAYATAAIIRTVTGNTNLTAKNVMQTVYGTNVSTEQSLSHSQVINYASSWGLGVIKSNSTLSADSVRNQIYAGQPIYLSCTKSTDSNSKHAVVLRGYSDQSSSYSVWNPNIYDYFGMDMNEKVHYSSTGNKWIWKQTLYGWN